MYKQESVLENEMHNVHLDFEIQMDHLISARRPHLETVKKKRERIWRIVDFAVPANYRVKPKGNKKKGKYLDLARELKKKTMEHENDR